jgi:hypothetical protein
VSLVEPQRVKADDVVDAEVLVWVVTLHLIPPDINDLLPRHRQHGRVLLHDRFCLVYQGRPLGGLNVAVDL